MKGTTYTKHTAIILTLILRPRLGVRVLFHPLSMIFRAGRLVSSLSGEGREAAGAPLPHLFQRRIVIRRTRGDDGAGGVKNPLR